MKCKKSSSIISFVIIAFITVLLILPARFYQSYSLPFFQTQTGINVNYLNVVDFVAVLICLLCIVFMKGPILDRKQSNLFLAYIFIICVCFLGLLVSGKMAFSGELFSKCLIVFCSLVVSNFIVGSFTEKEIDFLFLVPLLVLVVSSFFLKDYMEYGTTRRTGSIGFGSNETAMFACSIMFVFLFKPKIHPLLRVAIVVLCFACLLVVSSRRGIIIAVSLLILFILRLLFGKNKRFTTKSFGNFCLVAISLIILLALFKDEINSFITNSSLYYRFSYVSDETDLFSLEDRLSIYTNSLSYFWNHLLLGSFGSDSLFATDGFTHSHNLFLQILVTYGLLFGTIICIFFLSTFINALKVCFHKTNSPHTCFVPASFLIIFFISEQVGYILWNPKALFLVMLSVFTINKTFYSSSLVAKESNSNRCRGFQKNGFILE